MSRERVAAEVFPPGEFLREELEAREWTQADLAAVLGRPLQVVNEIVNGEKQITAETAKELAAALGTSARVWLSLEKAFRLAVSKDPNPQIAKRAAAIGRRSSDVQLKRRWSPASESRRSLRLRSHETSFPTEFNYRR